MMCRVRYLSDGISCLAASSRGGPVGPPATLNRKPRQARKGATVVVAACAGMWLSGPPPFQGSCFLFRHSILGVDLVIRPWYMSTLVLVFAAAKLLRRGCAPCRPTPCPMPFSAACVSAYRMPLLCSISTAMCWKLSAYRFVASTAVLCVSWVRTQGNGASARMYWRAVRQPPITSRAALYCLPWAASCCLTCLAKGRRTTPESGSLWSGGNVIL